MLDAGAGLPPGYTLSFTDPRQESEAQISDYVELGNELQAEVFPEDTPTPVEVAVAETRALPARYGLWSWSVHAPDGTLVARGGCGKDFDHDDNPELGGINARVRAGHRFQGIGRVLLATRVGFARALGETRLLGSTNDRRPDGERLARSLGMVCKQESHINRLLLDNADRAQLARWVDEGPKRAEGYDLVAIDGVIPDDLAEAFCELAFVMNSAPRDDLEVNDERMTVDQLREGEAMSAARGEVEWTFLVRERVSGELAGLHTMSFSPHEPTRGWVGVTGVRHGHRGHALGKWLKAVATLRTMDERPEVVEIRTGNADSNDAMLGINRAMGYEPFVANRTWEATRERVEAWLAERGVPIPDVRDLVDAQRPVRLGAGLPPGYTLTLGDPRDESDEVVGEVTALWNELDAEAFPEDPPTPVETAIAARRAMPGPDRVASVAWTVRDPDGAVVATGRVDKDLEHDDNPEIGNVAAYVRAGHRGQGIGTVLLATRVGVARALGQTRLMARTNDRRPDAARLCRSLGAEPKQETHTNRLALDELDVAAMERWVAEGPVRAAGYELEVHRGPLPDAVVEAYCDLMFVMNTAPRDDLELNDERITVEQVRDWEREAAATGDAIWVYLARERATGGLAGLHSLWLEAHAPTIAWVGDTGVLPAHRGHALGKWLKATATLDILAERPAVREIRTQNADSNDAMLGINHAMGYRPYVANTTWEVGTEAVAAWAEAHGVRVPDLSTAVSPPRRPPAA